MRSGAPEPAIRGRLRSKSARLAACNQQDMPSPAQIPSAGSEEATGWSSRSRSPVPAAAGGSGFALGKTASGEFDAGFYAVQAVERIVGAAQLALMGMNFRDGLKLAGKRRSPGDRLPVEPMALRLGLF